MSFVAVALGIGGAAAGLGGALISSSAASNAASTQAAAANNAAQLQYNLGQENLDLGTSMFNREQANELPFLEAGQNAIGRINSLTGQAPLSSAPAASDQPIVAPTVGQQGPPPLWANLMKPGSTEGPAVMRAKGGPVSPNYMDAAHYIVGEKGPEELTMFPNGTGFVTPHDKLPHYMKAIHRAMGGPVAYPAGGSAGPLTAQNSPVAVNSSAGGLGSPSAATATAPVNPWAGDPNSTADQSNPLVSGGSSTPTQNVPFTAWTQQFQAPTLEQAEAYPGYQFQLQQGENAILNNASALGITGSSDTAAALNNYAQNQAQSDYSNIYNQALQQYDQNYNIFSNNQANQWNRLAATAGIGQSSAGQLNNAGANYNTNAGNTLLNTGYNIGNQLNNAAAATASGYAGSANAWNSGLGNIATSTSLPLYLQMMNQPSSSDLPSYLAQSWLPSNAQFGQAYYPPQ